MTPTYRNLGASGLKVSPLWLGCMMFGDQTEEAAAADMLAAARDAGVNAIDTADVYAKGESESMLGRLLKTDRSRWVLATKVANPMSEDPNDRGTSRRWILRAVEDSLRRLATDRIDLYYLHRDDETTPMEETLSALKLLLDQGKILHYGLSNYRAWRLARMVETSRQMGMPQPIALQPPYSAVTRGIELELLPACAHYGLGAVTYSPLARGVLSGKYSPGAEPPQGSRAARADRRMMQTEWRPESVAFAQAFAQHAQARGFSAAQLAVAWVLNNQLVHSVIAGPRTLAQWQDYLAALEIKVSAEDEAWINERVPAGHASSFGYTDPQYPVTGRAPRTPA